MGTLANLYAIQQTFSIIKPVDKEDTKSIKSNDLMDNELANQVANNKSMYANLKNKNKCVIFNNLSDIYIVVSVAMYLLR